jgi:hypothetical protein
MTEPTEQDRQNAELRASVAARFRREFEEAKAFVESVLGPGFVPTGRHYLVAHDEEKRARSEGGRMRPAAVVIHAVREGVRKHVAVIGDQVRECSGYEDGFGEMLLEPDPNRTIEVKGTQVHPHRYSLYWAGYEPGYAPRSAEQLAAARGKREEKKEARERKELEDLANASLFPEWILEQAEEAKKGRKR